MTPPTKILFRSLMTMTGDTYENGTLTIEEGRIKDISSNFQSDPGPEVLDFSDCLILPGLVNAHCHLALSCLRGKLEPRPKFTDWVRDLLIVNSSISNEERTQEMHRGAEELLTSGVTSLVDYLGSVELLKEFESLAFRQILFLETLGFNSGESSKIAEKLKTILETNISSQENSRLQLAVSAHAPYSVSPDLFRLLKKLAKQFSVRFSCHVAEFAEEVRFLREGGGEMQTFLEDRGVEDPTWKPPGKSPVKYLESLGVLDSMTAVHLNYLDGEDLGLLVSRNVGAVFCPQSTRWFGRKQYMPVRKMLDKGITIGLGTDSLASNDNLNFLNELKVAEEMLPDVSRLEILHMATAGGADALGLIAGRIMPGRPADLVGFRVESHPSEWQNVPFESKRNQADFIMVEGHVVSINQQPGGI
jgi:cytosine/adenosine deaminase-related metal-dependent hydrolase